MRLDKWLKMSRLIKRRTVAQMACDQGRVFVNDRIAKSGLVVKKGDKVHIEFGSHALTVEVVDLPSKAPSVQDAQTLYRVLEEIKRPRDNLSPLIDDEEL